MLPNYLIANVHLNDLFSDILKVIMITSPSHHELLQRGFPALCQQPREYVPNVALRCSE